MSITAVTSTGLVVVDIVYSTAALLARLTAGENLSHVVEGLSSLQMQSLTIEFSKLRSIRWIEGETGFRLEYDDERGRIRSKYTYIATQRDRDALIDTLQECIGHQFRRLEQPAGVWRLAWSQIVGAIVSVLGTVFIYLTWDAVNFGKVRGGNIALWLGREGCTIVGCLFVAGCLFEAWRKVRNRPTQHMWLIWTV